MNRNVRSRALLAALVVILAAPAAGDYTVVGGRVVYEARTRLSSWQGENTALEGAIRLDPTDGRLSGQICVALDRWQSGNFLRDLHTRRMFDVGRYPKACFYPRRMLPTADGASLAGVLHIRDVEREIQIRGLLTRLEGRMVFEGRFETRVSDWNMRAPTLAGVQVEDEVQVWVRVELRPSG